MPSTPIYGWPYLNRTTDPLSYGAVSGENFLLAIESTLSTQIAALQADITAIEAVITTPLPGTAVARLRRSSASTIANGTAIPFNVEDWDDLSGHSTVSNTSRYTVPLAGRWAVYGLARHATGGSVGDGTPIQAGFNLNGVAYSPNAGISMNASPSAGAGVAISDTIECPNVGDYIELTVFNSQAQAVNCDGSIMVITYAGPIP